VALKHKSGVYLFALLALAALDASGAALARPAICSVLERQLASSGSGGDPSRYARAAAAQGEQIQIAREQARGAGCGGGFLGLFVTDSRPKSCSRILRTISRMEANRDALLRKRDALSFGGSSGSRRAILASLDLNNCNGARVTTVKADRRLPAAVGREGDQQASLFNQIFEESPARKLRQEPPKEKKIIQKVAKSDESSGRRADSYVPMDANGTVRTLCVRTCDGFYFPVSFSTTKDRFSKDAAACTALCPGAEAKLYYHSIPDEEPEQMVDLTGKTYMSSPNAFKYRVNGARSTPGCTCQAAQTEEISKPAAGEQADADARKAKKSKKWLPVPEARPNWLTDTESMADLRGGLTSSQLGDFLGRPDGTGATASLEPAKIRVVGPAFLPARTGEAGLQSDAQTSVR
jgi:Protein of unknown function (DUF2865)